MNKKTHINTKHLLGLALGVLLGSFMLGSCAQAQTKLYPTAEYMCHAVQKKTWFDGLSDRKDALSELRWNMYFKNCDHGTYHDLVGNDWFWCPHVFSKVRVPYLDIKNGVSEFNYSETQQKYIPWTGKTRVKYSKEPCQAFDIPYYVFMSFMDLK